MAMRIPGSDQCPGDVVQWWNPEYSINDLNRNHTDIQTGRPFRREATEMTRSGRIPASATRPRAVGRSQRLLYSSRITIASM